MANLLNDDIQRAVTRGDYLRLLHQYAALHYQNGRPDLEEDYDSATGKPIVGLKRSHHYFHSGFDDLVIAGLAGIRPREDDVLEVNPLIPSDPSDPYYLAYFAVQSVPYHGHLIDVVFDADGRHYGRGAGLRVAVDGKEVASAPKPMRLTVPLASTVPAAVKRPIDLAMALTPSGYPHANASVNADAAGLYPAIDGRVWFFDNVANGWTTAGAQGSQWFAVDFGKPVPARAAELAFYADGKTFAAPATVRLQILQGKRWVDVVRNAKVVANGITRLAWAGASTNQLRIVFAVPRGKSVRLVEMKVF
jgi:hypothetical protein